MSSATPNLNQRLSSNVQKSKEAIYKEVQAVLLSVLEDETNVIVKMATISSCLNTAFEAFFWTGFYQVNPEKSDELVVGPYQGTLGCTRIPFSKGVCGACATTQETIVVPNVHEFPGHIACDSKSQSEIVVPVFNNKKELIAVLDVDSVELATFDELDKKWLEIILEESFSRDTKS